jgi:hypothetical protein
MLAKMSWVDLSSDQRTQGVVPVVKILYILYIYSKYSWYAGYYAENSTPRSSLPSVILGKFVLKLLYNYQWPGKGQARTWDRKRHCLER